MNAHVHPIFRPICNLICPPAADPALEELARRRSAMDNALADVARRGAETGARLRAVRDAEAANANGAGFLQADGRIAFATCLRLARSERELFARVEAEPHRAPSLHAEIAGLSRPDRVRRCVERAHRAVQAERAFADRPTLAVGIGTVPHRWTPTARGRGL